MIEFVCNIAAAAVTVTAKLGLDQLLSVQQVSVELRQVVGCLLTDRADAIKELLRFFWLSCVFFS